ncbi:TIM barrel protein [candidate division KSB3 bacterium]|uniref:TIM barrel protein n=1 Tax=candidate division KSB3 bacterium TaxID=2044937 RepID=A0A9D5JTW9_9BACT|nr:TIM barrel protein [candidate division KSB3 bacterium]MBD3324168.1 TIM barrel protein [candidate division KSB3 bacterium]
MQAEHQEHFSIGIGSYSYRYGIGSSTFAPPQPMTVFDFLREAHRLHLQGVQLCENLSFAALPLHTLQEIKTLADDLGLFLELGMRDLTRDNLRQHLDIADTVSSHFLRVVLGKNSLYRDDDPETLLKTSLQVLHETLPEILDAGVTLGIENHFDLPAEYLVRLVQEINHEQVGLIFDTTNCLGFLKSPEETLRLIGPHLVSVHLKDYLVHKVEAGYLIRGAVLGEGWLNLEEILRSVLAYNSHASIIVEMTIRRDPEQATDETLRWEKQAVEQSVRALREALEHMGATA